MQGRWIPAIGGWLAGFDRPAAAVTLGRSIIVYPGVALTDALLRHELAHVRQWASHGVFFPILYIGYHLRHGYRDNPFEIQAREAETDGSRLEDEPA